MADCPAMFLLPNATQYQKRDLLNFHCLLQGQKCLFPLDLKNDIQHRKKKIKKKSIRLECK